MIWWWNDLFAFAVIGANVALEGLGPQIVLHGEDDKAIRTLLIVNKIWPTDQSYLTALKLLMDAGMIRRPVTAPAPVAAAVQVAPEPQNPHLYGTSDYDRWERQQYEQEWQTETNTFSAGLNAMGISYAGAEHKQIYGAFLDHTQAAARSTGNVRQPITVEAVREFGLRHLAGRDPEAVEYGKSLDNSTSEEIKSHVGMINDYSPNRSVSGATNNF